MDFNETGAPKAKFCVLEPTLFIATYASSNQMHNEKYNVFQTDELEYIPLCDDFGPYNISCVARFVKILEEELATYPNRKHIYLVERTRRALTNGAFLLGAFMMLKLRMGLDDVVTRFECMKHVLLPYRDATYGTSDFGLSIQDCWAGLAKAMELGWLDIPANDGTWGKVRIGEYEHYENPLNGDLVKVVPGKFIAFKGPINLGPGVQYRDFNCFRKFSPDYYVRIFKHLNVSTVIQLNDSLYDPEIFESNGIHHVDLQFPDCTAPPAYVVAAFLSEVEAAPGLVAVHCKAGLGRTGTLIAAHMMLAHGFTARAAIAWLRIMRPGSVIGQQQDFLCRHEIELAFAPLDNLTDTADAGDEGLAHDAVSSDGTCCLSSKAEAEGCQASFCSRNAPAVLAAQVLLHA